MAISLAVGMVLSVSVANATASPKAVASSRSIWNGGGVANQCLGSLNGQAYTVAILWDCNGNRDQKWRTVYRGEEGGEAFYQVVNDDDQCLGTSGGGTGDGVAAVVWGCNGNPDQDWFVGALTIQNTKSRKCLGVQGEPERGSRVIQWTCNVNPDQEWHWFG
jgi:L-aminopeptidase/D-esterase-like protein